MAATTTLKTLVETLAEETALGLVVPISSSTTTTVVDTTAGSSELRGPFTAAKIAIGSPVLITAGTDAGFDTYVSNFAPASGTITVSPPLTSADATSCVVIYGESEIDHGDRFIEAINRAFTKRIGRWELRPLTYVPDGDMQGATVTDYWTAAGGVGTAAAYVTAQVFPAGGAADAFGEAGVSRVVQLTSAGVGAATMDSNGIRVTPNAITVGNQWYVATAIRLVSGTGTVTFSVRDNSNNTAITVNVIRANTDNTFTQTVIGDYLLLEGTFNLPTNCGEIGFRLALSATGMVAQMAPVIAYPMDAMSFPMPNRIEMHDQVGNFYEATSSGGASGISNRDFFGPLSINGLQHWFTDYGDHKTVSFNCRQVHQVWYEEFVIPGTLTTMASTTTFPSEQVLNWAKYELYDLLMRRELRGRMRREDGTPLPSAWRGIRNNALRQAEDSSYEPRPITVLGRRR